ncbi:Mrr N-terminal domain-containing protein [Asanoa hainanensis]|uniref:Mrr N-terminal domain-containing protein n=1 Tax=Asanoa hainanensis TaxID=560556 RepID=A0A239P818_9ACTN|nr:winged helix-turn-helix domain-containing protein [Asanoa hainanensis]SNT62758.1 Mrr N-terminal domain-containing protein [Asanoa hainanensis]
MIADSRIETGILTALAALGGKARRKEVLDLIELRLGLLLHGDDTRRRPSGSDVVWKNRASFVRMALVGQGFLEPMASSGRGFWALTPEGKIRASSLASDVVFCPAFRSISVDVAKRMRDGRSVGLVPGETTFTDNVLLRLAVTFRGSIHIHRFNTKQEADNGADWEWWIRGHDGYVGFRVQAKRVDPRSARVALDQPAADSLRSRFPRQIDAFRERCLRDGIAGIYCVYNDGLSVPSRGQLGSCPHGLDDPDLWGCAIVLADTATRLANERIFDAATVLGAATPWHRLVCRDPLATLTEGVLEAFGRMWTAELANRRGLNERYGDQVEHFDELELDLGPAPATEPPDEVLLAFDQRDGVIERPWSEELAGIVLIDATGQ